MVKDNNTLEPRESQSGLEEDEKSIKLVMDIMAGKIIEIKPELDIASEMGFTYPLVEQTLGIKAQEAVSTLESLVSKDILKKDFFDRFLHCPQCQSVNMRPSTHCPKCGSGNIARGRILEHSVCGYVGLEDEFMTEGRLVCPKCQAELHTIERDYQSRGLMRKCHDCGEVFHIPLIKWRCLRCSSLTSEDKVTEVNIYSYRLNETKRNWLEFELKPKAQLIEFLKRRGYEVAENALKQGRSGAKHNIDILATRDEGVITHNIAIGVKVVGNELSLRDIFDFDDKAYDIGIHEKVLIVVPGLGKEAETFANQQRIKILQVEELKAVLAQAAPPLGVGIEKEPFQFKSSSQLVEHLKRHGYEVKEKAKLRGRSGAEHDIDILATRDDGIVTHHIAIGIEVSDKPIELDKVFSFDDKAYDIGIQDKVFIASPGLSREAKQFAERQRIRVFEVRKAEQPG